MALARHGTGPERHKTLTPKHRAEAAHVGLSFSALSSAGFQAQVAAFGAIRAEGRRHADRRECPRGEAIGCDAEGSVGPRRSTRDRSGPRFGRKARHAAIRTPAWSTWHGACGPLYVATWQVARLDCCNSATHGERDDLPALLELAAFDHDVVMVLRVCSTVPEYRNERAGGRNPHPV
jgi:hypothetical protein